jgi:AcrR family transcriptional regulator
MVTRRADALANQARVLDAARQVFAEQGLAAEIKDIADRAGVGVATIYRGFGSKNELLEATVEQAHEQVSNLYTAAEGSEDPVTGLRSLIEGLLDFAESYGWLIQASLAGDEIGPRFLKNREANRQRAKRLIERCMACGAIPLGPVDVVALLIEGSVLALTLRVRRQVPHPPANEIANGLVSLLTGSFGSKDSL